MFNKSLLVSTQSKVNVPHWDVVMDLYEEGKYRDATIEVLNYVDDSIIEKFGNPEKTEFVIPHGSVVVNLNITDTELSVNAPFLKVPQQNPIPLLRQVAQINFSPLNLAMIVLEGDSLIFKYSTPLELCEPFKVYDVLREICSYADTFDDDFIKKFGAIRITEPKVKYYSKEQTDVVWNTVQEYIDEAFKYIEYYQAKRWPGFEWDIIIQTLEKIDFYVAPQGALRVEMERNISLMQNKNYSLTEKLNKGREYLKKLKNYNRQEFDEDIYVAETFIPYKFRTTLENIQSNFKGSYENAQKKMTDNQFMTATLTIAYAFLNCNYNTNVPDQVYAIFTNSLVNASNKTWDQSAKILWKAIDDIMNNRMNAPMEASKKSKGFFGFFKKD